MNWCYINKTESNGIGDRRIAARMKREGKKRTGGRSGGDRVKDSNHENDQEAQLRLNSLETKLEKKAGYTGIDHREGSWM